MRMDITPLVQYLAMPNDAKHGCMVLRWLYHYRNEILQHEPLIALLVNERYVEPFLNVNYVTMELDLAIAQLEGAGETLQSHILETLHSLVDLLLIYQGEGPFTSSSWKDRIAQYESTVHEKETLP